jgi:hypothetical protein
MSNSAQDDEIEVVGYSSEDKTEYVVYLRRPGKSLTTEEICVELESLAHDMNKADLQMKEPGVSKH